MKGLLLAGTLASRASLQVWRKSRRSCWPTWPSPSDLSSDSAALPPDSRAFCSANRVCHAEGRGRVTTAQFISSSRWVLPRRGPDSSEPKQLHEGGSFKIAALAFLGTALIEE
ncbi:Hypothetical predicted protein [Marmota monax]|uniref:Uncharacterized protein n=1 Tax=Marmota monax TaxID=9995 RepID=A0A5E4CU52_MARMO|nr:hypothetical protein GHT09_009992 [Marmota monax]VTJ84482.1 Hypothetical predicted protein [Marmota monax]